MAAPRKSLTLLCIRAAHTSIRHSASSMQLWEQPAPQLPFASRRKRKHTTLQTASWATIIDCVHGNTLPHRVARNRCNLSRASIDAHFRTHWQIKGQKEHQHQTGRLLGMQRHCDGAAAHQALIPPYTTGHLRAVGTFENLPYNTSDDEVVEKHSFAAGHVRADPEQHLAGPTQTHHYHILHADYIEVPGVCCANLNRHCASRRDHPFNRHPAVWSQHRMVAGRGLEQVRFHHFVRRLVISCQSGATVLQRSLMSCRRITHYKLDDGFVTAFEDAVREKAKRTVVVAFAHPDQRLSCPTP